MRRVLTCAVALVAGLLTLLPTHALGGASVALPGSPTAGDGFTPQLGLPATGVVAFGSSPGQSAGETWAYGQLGQQPVEIEGRLYADQYALLEHNSATPAWQVLPLPEGLDGKPLAPSEHDSGGPSIYGSLAGQATQAGGLVLLSGQSIVIRDPEGKPRLLPAPSAPATESAKGGEGEGTEGSKGAEGEGGEGKGGEGKNSEGSRPAPALAAGESLLPPEQATSSTAPTVPYAATEESSGETGLLIAPYQDGGKQSATGEPESQPGVLHYYAGAWTREPIQAEGETLTHFTALALACGGTQAVPGGSSPEDCWLLAGYGAQGVEHLQLFRRVPASEPQGWSWKLQPVSDWLLGRTAPPAGVSSLSVLPLAQGAQMLTATAQGVWVDFQARVNGEAATVDVSELVRNPEGSGQAQSAGTWCYPTGTVCERSLGARLPSAYRSFAWPGSPSEGVPGDSGTRVITGLPGNALLELAGGSYAYTPGDGGEPGDGGAALYRPAPGQPVQGWIADGTTGGGGDEEGSSQAIAIGPDPEGDQLAEETLPFRLPLLAVAQAPGTTLGAPDAEALAVGLNGQVAHYVPGKGWLPEGLYDSAGHIKTPTLRGVAWSEPDRAYAVGDNGAMWVWRAETGLWEPDPSAPFNFIGNLTAIAFSTGKPQDGYAVGKQGVLLKYGKSWEQISKQESEKLEQELGVEEWRLNFTSIAFAGDEALASYRVLASEPDGNQIETGGLLVDEGGDLEEGGTGWHVATSASTLLKGFANPRDTVLSKVAGLPDGGAVAAGPDVVMEQEAPGAPWRASSVPLPEAQSVSALAAYREAGGPVHAIVSVDLDPQLSPINASTNLLRSPYSSDLPALSGPGQPPPFIGPDPVPDSGYVLKQTADGWSDMEHMALPTQSAQNDLPVRPEPVFALLVSEDGQQGLAVGGQTYNAAGKGGEEEAQTASAMRFPAAAEQHTAAAPLVAPAGQASFAIGGRAECTEACIALANEQIGPEVWLTHALQTAGRTGGVRAFMYTGGWTNGAGNSTEPEQETFARELTRFRELLDSQGAPPVYVAAAKDLEPPSLSAGPFQQQVEPTDGVPGTSGLTQGPAGTDAYAFTSTGSQGGPVRVIMLDYTHGSLGVEQQQWLIEQLRFAETEVQPAEPAIVMGYDALGFKLPVESSPPEAEAQDAEAVARILIEDKASAYIFQYPGVNVHTEVTYHGLDIPAYGTGTLGAAASAEKKSEPLYSSGFLLLSVNTTAPRERANVAPVTASVIPNTGRLALRAVNGTLLRRSEASLFEGLARRPASGMVLGGSNPNGGRIVFPHSYDPIPTVCQGPSCRNEVPLQYTFTSSKPDVGGFVEHEAASANPRQVQLGANDKPIPDEPRASTGELTPDGRFEENANGQPVNERGEVAPREQSGLFCAYNAGTTAISISAGGLTYSEPVTVQGGSAEYPCGTVPLKNPPARHAPAERAFSIPNLTPNATAGNPSSPRINLPVPPPPVSAARPHHARHPTPSPAFLFVPAVGGLVQLPPTIVPPAPTAARPSPPSGTSSAQVYQSAVAPEGEREREAAVDLVHNFAGYTHDTAHVVPRYLPFLIFLFALMGASVFRAWRQEARRPVAVEIRHR